MLGVAGENPRPPALSDNPACGIAQNLTSMYCLSTYVLEKCLLIPLFFTLRSKVELNWTRAILS